MSYTLPLGLFGSMKLEPELLPEHGEEKKRGSSSVDGVQNRGRLGRTFPEPPSEDPHLFPRPSLPTSGKESDSITYGPLCIFPSGPPLSGVWTPYICSLFVVKGFSQMVKTPHPPNTTEVPLLSMPPAGPPETIWGKKVRQESFKLKSVIMHVHAVQWPEPGTVTCPQTDP